MLTSTIFAFAISLFALSASAAPLRTRSAGVNEYCSPQIDGNSSTSIDWATYTASAWQYISSGEGTNGDYPTDTVIHDYRRADPVPSDIYVNISQWYRANDQYRISVGKINGVETCLGGRDDRISGADCDSPLAAWTISCTDCELYNGHPQGNCRFQATQVGTCATFTGFDTPMNLTECSPIDDGDFTNPQNNPQQFVF
ncbi:uncharacterized protein JCM6883_006239 [Sporobolomyces salmoneus]|uniref:uncharacterized protein n=1 Tax=Sporobolomyces salmoneus TaxID=183962 RepID=UPI0031828A6D